MWVLVKLASHTHHFGGVRTPEEGKIEKLQQKLPPNMIVLVMSAFKHKKKMQGGDELCCPQQTHQSTSIRGLYPPTRQVRDTMKCSDGSCRVHNSLSRV